MMIILLMRLPDHGLGCVFSFQLQVFLGKCDGRIRHFLLQIRQSTVKYPSQSVTLPSIFRRKTPKSVSVPVTFKKKTVTIRHQPSPDGFLKNISDIFAKPVRCRLKKVSTHF